MDRPLRSDIGGDDYLDALIGGFPDAVVVIKGSGEIIRTSSSVKSLLGWAPSQLIGQSVNVLIPEPHRSEHDGYIQRHLETGHSWALGTVREFDVVRKDGTTTLCEVSVSKMVLPGRTEPYFCGAIRGIADRVLSRKRLALSEAKFRAVFENENQFVLLLDRDGAIVEANRPTYLRTGCVAGDVLGRSLDGARFWSPEPGNREVVNRLLARAYEHGLATGRAQVDVMEESPAPKGVAPNGDSPADSLPRMARVQRSHAVSVRVLDEWEEGLPHALVEVREITELVRAEERETAIMRSLARVGEEAAVLAHELRSPVSELELALRAVSKELGEEEGAMVEALALRMRRLEGLLQRTLSFSRPLELDVQPMALDAAVQRGIERELVIIKRFAIRTSVRIPMDFPMIHADTDAFGDLFANVLRNAVEAQPEGGRVEIRAAMNGHGRALITVEDDGPGIAPERREEVFRVFATDKEGGTGFGLALVRKIAEAHGATVALEPGAGGSGLRVCFDWPCDGN